MDQNKFASPGYSKQIAGVKILYAPIGLEGFVLVLDQYVLLLSLGYAEPSCHY